ncbi:MAG: S9 family peptidase [Alphaproteobacteria bacterium]|nr:S9 family peptidase [Alphaproteobacteria bacterium]
MKRLYLSLMAALVLGATAVAAHAAFGVNDLIPRRVMFGNPERTAPLISPDGSLLAFTAPVDGVMNIWVAPVDDLAAAKAVTKVKGRPIPRFEWAPNGTHLLYSQDQGGNENYHLYAVDLADNTTKDLTPYKGARAELIAMSYRRPSEVLVGINNRDERWHDAWLINIVTGDAKLVLKNDGFAAIYADNALNIRLAAKPAKDGATEYLRRAGATWKPFITVQGDDALTTEPLFFGPGNTSVYMLDSRGRDKSALMLVNTLTKARTLIGEAAKSDVAFVISDPVTMEALAYSSEYERMEWHPLKSSLKADIEFLEKKVTGYWWVLSQSKDNTLWTVWIDTPGEPVKFGLYDRKTRVLTTLFAARPNLVGAPLPKIHPRVIKSRDGLDLVSYVTLPKGSDGDGDGVPDKPLPLVLFVHGGPWARDSLAYNPPAAWLSNRGYAVLNVNFRGSTGFGKSFVNAGDKEWGGKMHDDLIDAVDWAIDNGIAQKDKVAIYGASYGGYAALVGLAFTPGKFACGVDVVGPSNLNTMLTNMPAYWASFLETFKRRVGDPATAEGKKILNERSPLFRAAKIQRPLLIAQGANDPRVKPAEADQIVRAMQKKNLPVTYVLYADEGHGFARPENRLSFYAISEAFLAQCLGGRAEPFGDDFEGSSVTVPAGKENIKGLKDALARP